ncbi:MAG: ABC transporter ATP-binding protein, partial [Clostridiales bacterium]|nr:ABC transporter ATP-binding protein [Clostridiales bacterium]
MESKMLELVNITKDYPLVGNVVHALKGVSIKFRSSEFVSILGPSGCGKTTMLNIIGGLDRYTSGDLKIDGISTKDYTARDWDTYRNHKIGFVFQSYNLIQHLRVLQNVELALTISGVSPKEKREKAVKALERVGLKDEINKKPAQLSGGQMQRVAIARAIVNDPQIILADEPTGALDSATSVQVMDILKEISSDRLVIMVTHNADLANKYSSRIIKLLDGVKVSDSNPPGDDEIDEALKDAIVKKDDEMSLSKEKKNKRKKRSSMSLFTALSLSARNLVTKKFRTSLTTFAGSIGIIGIALVLSISNGFSKYMSKLERTTLASFPITVSSYALEVDTTATNYLPDMEGAFPDIGQIIPYEPENSFGGVNMHANMLTQDFVDYVKRMEAEHPDWAASVAYSQKVKMHVLTKTESNTYAKIDTANDSNLWWQELLDNGFVGSYYDILAGRLPQSKDELVLIVNSKNQITAQSLKALGFNPAISQGDGDYAPIDFSAIIGDASGNGAKELKLLTNDEYYKQTEGGLLFKELTTAEFEAAYNGAETTLKFVGIIRIKQTSDLVFFNSGVGYSPKLTHYVLEQAEKSKIAEAQAETYIDLLGDGEKLFEI